jgi:tetratricopeptide (TPR) repeat protein
MPIESFTINIFNIKPSECEVGIWWEKTKVSFKITEDIDAIIMKQIDVAMKGDKPPYGQAATYYYENGKDLKQAYEWINKAVEARPEAYWLMTTKAKIELKMGKNKEAIATSEKAKELALKDNDNSYVQQNDKLIAEAKAKK